MDTNQLPRKGQITSKLVTSKLACKMNKDYIGLIKIIYLPIDFDLVHFTHITVS